VPKLIPFGAVRRAEMAKDALRHYGIDTWLLEHPHVIVQHYTATTTFSSVYNTFAADVPDVELDELPGVCSHFETSSPTGRLGQRRLGVPPVDLSGRDPDGTSGGANRRPPSHYPWRRYRAAAGCRELREQRKGGGGNWRSVEAVYAGVVRCFGSLGRAGRRDRRGSWSVARVAAPVLYPSDQARSRACCTVLERVIRSTLAILDLPGCRTRVTAKVRSIEERARFRGLSEPSWSRVRFRPLHQKDLRWVLPAVFLVKLRPTCDSCFAQLHGRAGRSARHPRKP
jgi:hypothetical protein